MSDMRDPDDYIPSWNGQREATSDKLASGCMWVIGWTFGTVILLGCVGGLIDTGKWMGWW